MVGDAGGACGAHGVNEVSGVGGSGAEGGEVRSDGSGPVWAVGSGVESVCVCGGFEREGVEGCSERVSENEGEAFSKEG